MVNRPKILGTSAETAVANWLQGNGHPQAERRTLRGRYDRGDVLGVPGITIEVKYAQKGLLLGPWLRETETERINDNGKYGILVMKPKGVGAKNVDRWIAAMYHLPWRYLVNEAFPEGPVPIPIPVSGAKVNQLPSIIRAYPSYPEHVPWFLVQAVGKAEQQDVWYVVSTLEEVNRLLLRAGYGTEG